MKEKGGRPWCCSTRSATTGSTPSTTSRWSICRPRSRPARCSTI
ncbi:hypothetical protein NKG94_11625 [Micromonospora sp. M12]